ncbi:hypothetical protein CALCODRAFT_480346 [Calocera cornea HHB12733]|uniref:SANT domain-containing protein n=1 Tax=Calocera cornea HHB12733 TaxID=1353952 RepID=A0A165ITH7_9BASI|nr:hypothetical protein CALCODRAFT_480346 [Calocera cornea HHB12733]
MDDGRLPGTSSSTRSPPAPDREISPSQPRRRPSYDDETTPAAAFGPRKDRYPSSPTRHPRSLHSIDEAGPSNYASRSPRTDVRSPREGVSPRTWEMNKSHRDPEAGYTKARWPPVEGVVYDERRDRRESGLDERRWPEKERPASRGYGANGWPDDRASNGLPNGYEREGYDDRERLVSPVRARYPPPSNGLYGGPLPYPPLHSPNGHQNGYELEQAPYEARRPASRDRPYGEPSPYSTPSKLYPKGDYFQNGHRFVKQPYSTPARQSRTPSPPSTIDLTTPHKRRLQASSPEDPRTFVSPAFSRHSEVSPSPELEPPRRNLFPDAARRQSPAARSSLSRERPVAELHPSPTKSPLPQKISPAQEEPLVEREEPQAPASPANASEELSPMSEVSPTAAQADETPSIHAPDGHAPTTSEDVEMLPGSSTAADSLAAEEEGETKPAPQLGTMGVDVEEQMADVPAEPIRRTPEELQEMVKILQSRYKYLDRQWRMQTERIDRIVEGRKKRFALEKITQTPVTPGTGFLFSDVESPAVPTRSSRRSAANVFFGDAVRSDLEMEAILEKIQMEESQDATFRSRYTTANIPDMDIVTEEVASPKVDISHELVTNPEDFYGVKASPDRWTPEEEEMFAARYAQTPKQFGEIAEGLENKTPGQCVEYYYLNKRVLDFRGKSTTGKRKAGRKAGKGKGRSIVADIQAAEEKGQKQPRREKAKEKVAEDTPPAEEETTTSDAESPGQATTQLPEVEFQDSPMEVDSTEPASADVTLRLDTKASDLPIMPLPGTGSYATTGVMYASPNDPRSKRSKLGLEVDSGTARRRSATSSYWSVQEKLTAVTSHESHGPNYGRIAADVGSKTATQIRNFFQHQTAESIAELSSRARAEAAPLPGDSMMDTDPGPEPVNRSHTSTPQRWQAHSERESVAPIQVKSEYQPRMDQPIVLPSIPPAPYKTEAFTPAVDDETTRYSADPGSYGASKPLHQLPPISSLPFDSPSTFGDRFAPGKSRLPISHLLNDEASRSPSIGSNTGVRDFFGEPKRLLPHELEPRSSSGRFPIPMDREWQDRRSDYGPSRAASVDPTGDYRATPREEYGTYPSGFASHSRPSEYGRPADAYPPFRRAVYTPEVPGEYRYEPARVGVPVSYGSLPSREGWPPRPVDDYALRHPSPPPFSHGHYPERSLPPISTDFYRRPSGPPDMRPPSGRPDIYPYSAEYRQLSAPSPRYHDHYREPSVPAPYGTGYEARRLPPLNREYSSYRTPPVADNPVPSGYYEARPPPPDDYYDRPSALPPSQPTSAWPAEQERHRYPSEYPADYHHDRGYHGR